MGGKKLRVAGGKPLWDEELRSWLERYIEEHPHQPTEVLARSYYIGLPRIIIEKYLEGTYYLPNELEERANSKKHDIEASIRRFRNSIEGTARHNFTNIFVETRTWVQVQNACSTAINENAIVVIYGQPGVGKSRCLREYMRRNMTTSPIHVLCSRLTTPLYFVQKIARNLGLSERIATARLEDDVAEKLVKYPRPLFIDQANYLGEKSLGTVCYIWEVARTPIVLAGTKSLYELFITSQLTEDVRAQLSSRVAMHYPLSNLSLQEAKSLIQRMLGDEATDDVVAQIQNITGGIFRHIEMIFPRIFELRTLNAPELASGKVKLSDLISRAGARLLIG